jgi:hypothetical protein
MWDLFPLHFLNSHSLVPSPSSPMCLLIFFHFQSQYFNFHTLNEQQMFIFTTKIILYRLTWRVITGIYYRLIVINLCRTISWNLLSNKFSSYKRARINKTYNHSLISYNSRKHLPFVTICYWVLKLRINHYQYFNIWRKIGD